MKDQNVWQLLLQAMKETDVRVWIGLAVILAVGIVEGILYRKGLIYSHSIRRMQQAREKGHMMRAQLIFTDFDYFTDGDAERRIRTYTGTYEYEVNGRSKKVTECFHGMHPPRTLTMYYVSDPEKAFSEMKATNCGVSALMLLIPVAAGAAVTILLGFRG